MAQTSGRQSELDSLCARARPWVRQLVEDHQDGRPWGYAIFEDPTIEEEVMEDFWCRVDNMLEYARRSVYGRGSGWDGGFPKFKFEILDWPEGEVDELPEGQCKDGDDDSEDGDDDSENGDDDSKDGDDDSKNGDDDSKDGDDDGKDGGDDSKDGGDDSKDGVGEEVAKDGAGRGPVEDDMGEAEAEDDEISLGSADTDSEQGENGGESKDGGNEHDTDSEEEEEEEEEDDADIETVREFNKLRAHFKWVRDRAKKRRLSHQPLDVDLSGIPKGLLRNVFLVIDQDVIDSVVADFPRAWIWAVDPDYTGKVASMTKNGLTDEYYGYMRVRLQQLVNNFWNARYYQELPMPTLWEAAQQSWNHTFVSMDPVEARMSSALEL